jgi:mRNA-degrading endonuclease RelE of RelBE toxin-antitoxin system
MMSFRVRWSAEARQKLAAIWLAASDRNAVTRACDAIDKALARDPIGGEELSEELWKIGRAPLVAYYEIDKANKIVNVTGVSFLP